MKAMLGSTRGLARMGDNRARGFKESDFQKFRKEHIRHQSTLCRQSYHGQDKLWERSSQVQVCCMLHTFEKVILILPKVLISTLNYCPFTFTYRHKIIHSYEFSAALLSSTTILTERSPRLERPSALIGERLDLHLQISIFSIIR